MAEYIEREALIQEYRSEIEKMREYAINIPNGGNILGCLGELAGMRMALEFIQRYPAADVVEVRHGQYISTGYDELYCGFGDCSICGANMPRWSDYCPNCGAKMDGGDDNDV